MYFWLLNFCFRILVWAPLVIQLKYCPVLPSLNKVDYYYYYYYYYYCHCYLKPLHPKHKLLLYSRYVLCKLPWHFTIANISKTWITEHLDSVVNGCIRKWLDIPISGTLSNVSLERNKFGLNICSPSFKFTQC